MNLSQFRLKVQNYRRISGYSQTELALALGIQLSVISRKFSETSPASFTHPEIKQIIKALATWKAISSRVQAIELLELVNLNVNSFTVEEWNMPPLSYLEITQAVKIETEPGIAPATEIVRDRNQPITLPAPVTNLIGRKWETAQVCNLLTKEGTRLVTLLGPGGTGKTRLALNVAAQVKADFPDGVYFVNLASVTDPALILPTIVQTLGIVSMSDKSVENILRLYLQDKNLLLVLDNFEQLVEAASLVAGWLEDAAALKVLVTSRIVLGLYGERQFVVPPLSLPDLANLPVQSAELEQYEAVALFVERAQAYNFDFVVTAENGRAVAQICVLLDGLPLALELAAARLKLMSASALLKQLQEHSLKLLSSGPAGSPFRHQSLANTLDWSYWLLSSQEQLFFRRLAVFSRSWTQQAAEAVCGGENVKEEEVAGMVERLVNHSLLMLDRSKQEAETHYYLLETVRQYALEKLLETKEEVVWEQTVIYFDQKGQGLDLTAYLEARLDYSDALRALTYLPDNPTRQRQYLDILLRRIDVSFSNTDVFQLEPRLNQAEVLVRALLQIPADRLRLAWLHYWLGYARYLRREYGQAKAYFYLALEVAQELEADDLGSRVNGLIGRVLNLSGDYINAKPVLERAIRDHEKTESRVEWANSIALYATTLCIIGQYQAALSQIERAKAQAVQIGNLVSQSYVYQYEAIIYYSSQNATKTLESSQAGIDVIGKTNEQLFLSITLVLRAWAESRYGYAQAARESLAEVAVQNLMNQGVPKADVILVLEAEIAFNLGKYEEACKLAQQAINRAKELQGLIGVSRGERVWAQALAKINPAARTEIEAHLAVAVQAFEDGGALLEIAHTYLIWGEMCQDWGDIKTARGYYERAAAQYQQSELTAMLEKVRERQIGIN